MIPVGDNLTRSRPAIATWTLIALCGLVFAFELSLSQLELQALFYWFGFVPGRYTRPEWAEAVGFAADWRPWVTSMFLHGDWVHLLANLWTLRIFGDDVEEDLGAARFLALYFLSGVLATAVHAAANADSLIPTVGASGAISGVLAVYLWRFCHARLVVLVPLLFIPLFFEVPVILYLVFWLASQLLGGIGDLGGGAAGGIAWWAHLGGFAAGLLLYPVLRRRDRTRGLPTPTSRLIAFDNDPWLRADTRGRRY